MPELSSWKTPVVSTRWNSLNVSLSSSGISLMLILMPRPFFKISRVFSIMVRFFRPKKSIFNTPMSSTACISYWVIMSFSSWLERWRGIYSSIDSGVTTTPQAWVEAWRAQPSSFLAISIKPLAVRISHYFPEFRHGADCLVKRGKHRNHFRHLVAVGIRQAHHPPDVADRRPGGHRAEGDDLGDMVAAVFFRNIIQHLVAAGIGKIRCRYRAWRSFPDLKIFQTASSYLSGSISVILVRKATRLPAAEPRPGPTTIPLFLAQLIKSETIKKYEAKPVFLIISNSYSSRWRISGDNI